MSSVQLLSLYAWHITAGILALGIICAGWLGLSLRRKWNAVFGVHTKNRTEALEDIAARLVKNEEAVSKLAPRVSALERIGTIAIQKVAFRRFNPFEHTGGDQSFVLALLDREHNGVVISSLYTREGVRVYAKEIFQGTPKHQLSEEEREALASAMQKE